jgi:hypothetical protein
VNEEDAAVWVHVRELVPWDHNPRKNDRAVDGVAASIKEFGFAAPIVAWKEQRRIVAGHTRLKAMLQLLTRDNGFTVRGAPGPGMVPVRYHPFRSENEANAYTIADNRLGEAAEWDDSLLVVALQELQSTGLDLELVGFNNDYLDQLINGDPYGAGGTSGSPPFSVLDGRQGYWKDRKDQWISLGLASQNGRGKDASSGSGFVQDPAAQFAGDEKEWVSVFDPVLCELVYRWFSPQGGAVLDPFAGGSVRGVVAAALGRRYHGVDLRPEQVKENAEQWGVIGRGLQVINTSPAPASTDSDFVLTPVERRGTIWLKRDDLFSIAGARGGKARTCWKLAQGAAGLVTAGSKASPQVNIVAHVAKRLGIPCRVHTPSGDAGPEVQQAVALGAERVVQKPGHNSVIIARARADAAVRGWVNIPFGMECNEAVQATREQVQNIPAAKRLVIAVGSGMSLAGVLWGLRDAGRELPVLGIVVGADPEKRLDLYAPPGWRKMVTLVPSGQNYHDPAPVTTLEGVQLDPIYESKMIPFVQPEDCVWCVGMRSTAVEQHQQRTTPSAPVWYTGDSTTIAEVVRDVHAANGGFDLVFSCPPYADLEVYSSDPRDISNMEYSAFIATYRKIIASTCFLLKNDRFACFVVGDIRAQTGEYRNFVAHTVDAFLAAGLKLYNEAIFVTPTGSLRLRAGKAFSSGRKLGKTHQNVLVFVKGDPTRAARACGIVDVSMPESDA